MGQPGKSLPYRGCTHLYGRLYAPFTPVEAITRQSPAALPSQAYKVRTKVVRILVRLPISAAQTPTRFFTVRVNGPDAYECPVLQPAVELSAHRSCGHLDLWLHERLADFLNREHLARLA